MNYKTETVQQAIDRGVNVQKVAYIISKEVIHNSIPALSGSKEVSNYNTEYRYGLETLPTASPTDWKDESGSFLHWWD